MLESQTDKGLGQSRTDAIIRTPQVKIVVDKWDFEAEKYRGEKNITNWVMNYTWQKTIKTPSGGCTITLLPQSQTKHVMDSLNIMDVVRIYEFGTLKFQGYIRKIGAAGWISPDGKPHRTVQMTVTSFGAYFVESIIGINMSIFRDNLDFMVAAEKVADEFVKAGDELNFQLIIEKLVNGWMNFIAGQIGDFPKQYIFKYLNYKKGIADTETGVFPKELYLFNGNEDKVTFWDIIQKLMGVPLNEFFFDEGPRMVHLDGKDYELNEEKTYLIGRPTPFDGAIINGNSQNRFRVMQPVKLPLQYLMRFDLSKSKDEIFSHYLVSVPEYDMSQFEIIAAGKIEEDSIAFKKYLYKPSIHNLYYLRFGKEDSTEQEPDSVKIKDAAGNAAKTLKNWYENNDRFLSGVITHMVPSNPKIDPRIGQKLALEGIDGDFYVEGVAHIWNYGGALKSNTTVTRGWSSTGPIKLLDRIFKQPKMPYFEESKI